MWRYAILIATALATSATAKSQFQTKLIAHVSSEGAVVVELNLTNNTSRDICFDSMDEALLRADDGSILGNPHIRDLARSSNVSVVWANGGYRTEWPDVNSDGQGLSAPDQARLKQVALHFEAYDCLQLFELHGKASVLYNRDLTATPTFER